MKKVKIISMFLSGVMALSTLGSLFVSAEEEKLYSFSELEAMSDEEFFALSGTENNYKYLKSTAMTDGGLNFKFVGPLELNPSYKPGETENTINELFGDIDLSITTPYTTGDLTVDYIQVSLDDFNYLGDEVTDERCMYVAKSYYCLSQVCKLCYDDSCYYYTTSPNINYGDANDDGEIDIRDAAFIAQKIAGKRADQLGESADYNQDGKRDIRDAAAIAKNVARKYTTGLIVE